MNSEKATSRRHDKYRRQRQDAIRNLNDVWGPYTLRERFLWAASRGNEVILRQTFRRCSRVQNTVKTALNMAVRNGHLKIVRILIEEYLPETDMRNKKNASLVLTAARYEHFEIVQYLMSRRVQFAFQAIKWNDDNNIFHVAAIHGMPLHVARDVMQSHPDAVGALLQRNSRGLTPAQEALANGRYKLHLFFEGHVHGAGAA
ncbi:ankyrin repeat domain protein [Nitzschia inconspicua]|uniref:Ankyrin repeat domain protein n=1 Tax=Nitzschia inconspicua TaxID=303405 RepID=A0A9K3KND2_9STRA|nr:ankyrin repeat domain protein [Nitzschia inconspicua]